MGFPAFNKDPDEVLDYGFDWSNWLEDNDTISSSSWTVPSGITKNSSSNTITTTNVFLSGGTAGKAYDITNRIVTAGGRTADRTMTIIVRER